MNNFFVIRNRIKNKVIFYFYRSIILLLFPISSFSQDGALDPTFNSFGIGFAGSDGANGQIWASALQNDGKIIIGGDFTNYNGIEAKRIARLNTDGTFDESFDIGEGFNNTVYSIIILNNNGILVGGDFTNYNTENKNRLALLNSNGILVSTFNNGQGANGKIRTIAVLPNGKIIIGGSFTQFNGVQRNKITQLNYLGNLDQSFNPNLEINGLVTKIALQSDGKIVIVGDFNVVNESLKKNIARLKQNGTLDDSFNIGSGPSDEVLSIAIQNNGKILVGGKFQQYNGNIAKCIVRLNQSGTIDTDFQSPLTLLSTNKVSLIVIQPDNNILISGKFSIGNNKNKFLLRLTPNGLTENTFQSPSKSASEESIVINSINIQNDGRLTICGDFFNYFESSRKYIARLNSNGELEYAGANDYIKHVAKQGNKTIIGGFFTAYNGENVNFLARLNENGSLDHTFNNSLNVSIQALSIQSDGKILISGGFSNNSIYRLNLNGTIDNSFNQGLGPDNTIDKIIIQANGKIMIAGFFTSYNGIGRNCIARLNEDGSLDESFNIGTGFGTDSFFGRNVSDLFLYPNGKILAVGEFTFYNGIRRNRIALIKSNGDIDNSFKPGSGADFTISHATVLPNGKILIAGGFSIYDGIEANRFARLNLNGKLDTSFEIGTGPNRPVSAILISNGKILIGGSFTVFNEENYGGLVRLNYDGSIDETFDSGMGVRGGDNPFGDIEVLLRENSGKILIGGDFTSYNETDVYRIARILAPSNGSETSIFMDIPINDELSIQTKEISEKLAAAISSESINRIEEVSVYPNPSSSNVTITSVIPTSVKIINLLGEVVRLENIQSTKIIDVSNLEDGLYLLQTKEGLTKKFIKN
jgi:uncharacterized delta-60 repeat protein